MWKQKVGTSVGNMYPIPTPKVVKICATIGFEAVSPEWKTDIDFNAIAMAAKEIGITLQAVHAPYSKPADIWNEDDEKSAAVVNEYIACFEDCNKYEIPVAVIHPWAGLEPEPMPTDKGFENFDKVVEVASKYGVQVAFENTERQEVFLSALMERYKNNNTVGFCWDRGHELCYNKDADVLGTYGNRLIMTHINDNLGISDFDGTVSSKNDLHLLPFDGISDWDEQIKRLKNARPQEILNLEISRRSKPNRHENDAYTPLTMEQYFTECYKRACRLAAKYSK